MRNFTSSKLRCLVTLTIVSAFCYFMFYHNTKVLPVTEKADVLWNRFSDPSREHSETLYIRHAPDMSKTVRDHRCNTPDDQAQLLKHIAGFHKVPGIDCPALFNNSKSDIEHAKKIARNVSTPLSDSNYITITADCRTFVNSRGYILSPLTKEEEDFPLAFSILAFKEVEMVERLLRAIYRPQNYYCIHVDNKSSELFYNSVSAIAKCFSNVFVARKRVDVQWGTYTVLEPEIRCMEELWRYPKWKYFIDLTGQEFPLKTNYELVKILTVYDGANDVEGKVKRANKERWRAPPPFGIRPVKGAAHITVNRDFVDYILHNETAKALLYWTEKNTSVGVEVFFATLNHNPQLGIRGSYKGINF
ncbi:hypothetical protein BsWGS_16715 [Bradybaena similaris]